MALDFDPEVPATLSEQIEKLERTDLEDVVPEEFDLSDIFNANEQTYFFVQGLTNFWNANPGVGLIEHITDLVSAAHNQRQDNLTFVLSGTPEKCSLLVSLGSEIMTKSVLEGILPGIELHSETISANHIARSLHPHFQTKGLITGIPSLRIFTAVEASDGIKIDTYEHSTLERTMRGMYGATWAYVVQASPRPRYEIAEQRLRTIDQLETLMSPLRKSVQVHSRRPTNHYRKPEGEVSSYRVQYLVKLLERELERLEEAGATGQWSVRTYFGASTFDDAQRLGSLLVGTLAGRSSSPEPIRAILCRNSNDWQGSFNRTYQGNKIGPQDFSTLLSSSEVARLVHLPREEVAGYAIHDAVQFDVDFRTPDVATLALGYIRHNERDTQNTFNIALDDLTKHCVVVGVTGSGKTTTVMNLLDRVVEVNRPFLVIEPAKTEYRALLMPLAERIKMRVYTLGSETVAPFRLNPFEFETDEEPGSASILSHIDFLKAVFNAAFILYVPMPHVLEESLHEIYEDKGWDLASGLNSLVPNWADRNKYPIFPTLTDLYRKVEVVTERLHYHNEVESNVKAGLKARIGSLRLGSKGLMLDTPRGVPMRDLLSTPTVLEMENIGNDDEKTFLIGLFLAKLYEYRRLQAATGTLPEGLQHLIIFEEAHRLLKNTYTQVDVESANPRAQAVEVFTNMLSEIRAYGQGVLVAEQIPSKLAPDVLKNTNLKIVHRLTASDDRRSVGETMNLTGSQMTRLGVLAPGEAVVYAEGIDHAYLVRLENYQRKLKQMTNAQLRQHSPSYASVKPYQAIMDMERYNLPSSPFGGPNSELYQVANKLIEIEKHKWIWSNVFLRVCYNQDKILELLLKFAQQIEEEVPRIQRRQRDLLLKMVLIQGCAIRLSERGARFGWTYSQVEELRIPLTRGLIELVENRNLEWAAIDLNQFVSLHAKLLQREQGPFAGCVHCQAKCIYRADVDALLSSKDKNRIENELISTDYESLDNRYKTVAWIASSFADRWLGEVKVDGPGIGYCAALQITDTRGYTEYEQMLVGDSLAPRMFVGNNLDQR